MKKAFVVLLKIVAVLLILALVLAIVARDQVKSFGQSMGVFSDGSTNERERQDGRGDLGGIGQFLNPDLGVGVMAEDIVQWFDWDEENSHAWEMRPCEYAETCVYSDTGIPIEAQQTGQFVYTMDDVLDEYPDGLYVVPTGWNVTVTIGDLKFSETAFIGAWQVEPGMVFDITDGSISLVMGEADAMGEVCARAQQSVVDYGSNSIQVIDVPEGWTCSASSRLEGMFKDPTRHNTDAEQEGQGDAEDPLG